LLNIEDIKRIVLFSGLGDAELKKIINFSRLKNFNKGEMIFFDSEPYQGFYCLLEGRVKLFKYSTEGKEHIIHIVDKYQTFAEVPVFENYELVFQGKAHYPVNAMALKDGVKAVLVDARQFINFLNANKDLCFKLLSTLSKRLRFLTTHIESITLQDIKMRTAKYLVHEYHVQLEKKSSKIKFKDLKNSSTLEYIDLDIAKCDIAFYIGTTLETFSRMLRKLQDDKIIEVMGRKIKIKDLDRLIKESSN